MGVYFEVLKLNATLALVFAVRTLRTPCPRWLSWYAWYAWYVISCGTGTIGKVVRIVGTYTFTTMINTVVVVVPRVVV